MPKWNCLTVQQLFINFINLCKTKTNIVFELNQDAFMFGKYKSRENIRHSNVLFIKIKHYLQVYFVKNQSNCAHRYSEVYIKKILEFLS